MLVAVFCKQKTESTAVRKIKGERRVREILDRAFSELNIEYYSVLDYSNCIESAEHIRRRAGFTPRSAVIYLLPYYTGECVNLSRYAASLDYHIAIREVGEKVISVLSQRFPEASFSSFGDHSPIDERHAALISGLGIAGDNGLLINEKYGSYVFVGDILTDLPPELLCAEPPEAIVRCEGCGACKLACPTGILRGEGEDCLSAITQRKGQLTESEMQLMRQYNTAWGCDECQSSCPHNLSPRKTPIEFFYKDRIDALTPDLLAAMDKEALRRRAFGWRGRAALERNLAVLSDAQDCEL